ncbi:MAG: tetratricopeptide repeat protein [Bacteroidetes bacterium]|nr:tetratricopeptide repeat protein [Bacteroidota bacterium]
MDDNISNRYSRSVCPTEQVLEDYFFERLPEEEKHTIEQHLLDCNMCSDVLDGLGQMEDPGAVDKIIQEVHRKMDIPGRRQGQFRRRILAVVAVFALLIGSWFIFRFIFHPGGEEDKYLAKETNRKPAEITERINTQQRDMPPHPEKTGEMEKEKKAEERRLVVESEPVHEVPKPEGTGISGQLTEVIPVPEETVQPELTLSTVISKSEDIQKYPEGEPVDLSLPAIGGISTIIAEKQETMAWNTLGLMEAKSRRAGANSLETAMEEFRRGEYAVAILHFKHALKAQKDTMKIFYHLGYCYLEQADTLSARMYLEKVVQDPGNEYFAPAKNLQQKLK